MIRILFVITGLRLAGAETQLMRVAEGLVARGHEVRIVYLAGPLEVVPNDPRVSIRCVAMSRTMLGLVRGMQQLRREIVDFAPQIVHAHLLHANIVTRLIALTLPDLVLINTVHSIMETENLLLRWLLHLTQRLTAIITFVSDEAKHTYISGGLATPEHARTVYNGIDTELFQHEEGDRDSVVSELGIPPGALIVLAVGRLELVKDFPNLLEAFEIVSRSRMDVHLVLAGEGSQRAALEALRSELSLCGRVHLVGSRADIPRLMSAADIFALSSAREGFGLVVAEAMASELFVVATDSGGVREVVGPCGILVPPQAPAALAAALSAAAAMGAHDRSKITSSARDRIVSNYSVERTLDEWLDVYGSFLRSDPEGLNA